MFKNLTSQEKAWVLYDVGNSAFTMLACSLIPIWFKELAIGTGPGQISGDQATAYYSIAIAVVTNLVKTTVNVVVKRCAKDVNVSKTIANV